MIIDVDDAVRANDAIVLMISLLDVIDESNGRQRFVYVM